MTFGKYTKWDQKHMSEVKRNRKKEGENWGSNPSQNMQLGLLSIYEKTICVLPSNSRPTKQHR